MNASPYSDVDTFDRLLAEEQKRKRPPIDQWFPEAIGEDEMRIDANGDWFHNGEPIKRIPMVKLFASILRREDDDRYFLISPDNKIRVTVEDVPFLIVDFYVKQEAGRQMLLMITDVDDAVLVGAGHELEMRPFRKQQVPYLRVRDNLFARLNRSAYYRLTDLIEQGDDEAGRFGVWSSGCFYCMQ